jgi:hypothetical protein
MKSQNPNPRAQRVGFGVLVAVGFVAAIAMVSAQGKSDVADAAMKGDVTTVRALIAKKVDVNAPQNDGATALHWAVFRGDAELANLLIRAGANVKAANREGVTPLWLASVNGAARRRSCGPPTKGTRPRFNCSSRAVLISRRARTRRRVAAVRRSARPMIRARRLRRRVRRSPLDGGRSISASSISSKVAATRVAALAERTVRVVAVPAGEAPPPAVPTTRMMPPSRQASSATGLPRPTAVS